MVVRVRVALEASVGRRGARLGTAAVANAGYETLRPELMIPIPLAEELGLWPRVPKGTIVDEYMTAGGVTRVHKVRGAVKVTVLTEDKSSREVRADAAISEHEQEVLLGDKLLSALQIVIEDAGKGLWRFREDPPARLRKSTRIRLW